MGKPRASNTNSAWREKWRNKDAWNLQEFTFLCCGWEPGPREAQDLEMFNDTRAAVETAVRIDVLPTLALKWPLTLPERLYGNHPLFSPSAVTPWAVKRYPTTFPYTAADWPYDQARRDDQSSRLDKAVDPRERKHLLWLLGTMTKALGFDISVPHKAASSLEAMLDNRGLQLSSKTIANFLSSADKALEVEGANKPTKHTDGKRRT
jgi:hypothetical protein